MDTSPLTVGFSGNRPSDEAGRSPEDIDAMRPLLNAQLRSFINKAQNSGKSVRMVSSLAAGADTLAAEVALELGMRLHLILPKPVEQFRKDFMDDPAAWQRASVILQAAEASLDGVTMEVINGPYNEPDCYQRANQRILECSDAMVALWNGEDSGKAGGTGEIVRLAAERKLPSILLNTKDLTPTASVNFDVLFS